jgi:phospholipid N-methyltransferase
MNPHRTTRAERSASARRKPQENWVFFRQWLKNPLAIAALSPSGKRLARQMIGQLPAGTRRVVELGGGTGVFTRLLIETGIDPGNLMVLELNEELYRLLKERFPEALVVRGDARDLRAIVRRTRFTADGPVDAILSGLGLLSMSRAVQRAILEAAFATLAPDGRFVQFTYGPASPVPRDLLNDLGLVVRRAGVAWMNVPPATVYVYSRSRTRAIRAIRPGGEIAL